jgi:hypothetical protein
VSNVYSGNEYDADSMEKNRDNAFSPSQDPAYAEGESVSTDMDSDQTVASKMPFRRSKIQ